MSILQYFFAKCKEQKTQTLADHTQNYAEKYKQNAINSKK